MSPLIHLITAWIIAVLLTNDTKARRIVMISGVIADIDGIFIFWSIEDFSKYHHGFGHSFVYMIPVLAVLSIYAGFSLKKWAKTFAVSVIGLSSHLLLDIIGTNWPVAPFSPFSTIEYSIYPTLSTGMIYGVVANVYAIIVVILMFVLIIYKQNSPLEFISKKLDGTFVGFFRYPLTEKCKVCGERAYYHCQECGKYSCADHVDEFFSIMCPECKKSVSRRPEQKGEMKRS